MEEYEKDYKNLTKAADFILLVVNKIVSVVNGRFAWHAADLNEFINSNNTIGLKKKHTSWPDLIKNYASMLTGINNMVSMNASMNFSRKQLVKNQDVEKNTEKIEVSSQKFIDSIENILLCLEFFSKNIDIVQPKSKEVNDMTSVHKIIETALEKIKKTYLPKVKQIKLDTKLKTVGADEDGYQVIVGGENEKTIRIGGFNIEKTVKHDLITLDLFEKDLETLRTADAPDVDNYIKKFAAELEFFSSLADLPEDKIAELLIIRSHCTQNLADQFLYILTHQLNAIMRYHQQRFNQQNEYSLILNVNPGNISSHIKYKDEYGEIDTIVGWGLHPEKSVIELVNVIKQIFQLIDAADKHKLLKDAKKCFHELNEIKSSKLLLQKIDEMADNYKLITDKEFTFESRQNAKNTINRLLQKILDMSVAESTNIIELPRKTAQEIVNIDALSNLISKAKQTVNTEVKLMPSLKEKELKYDNITNILNELMTEINVLISPDNKHTCIKRPSLVLTSAISAVVIENLVNKRFQKDEKIDKIKQKAEILSKLKDVCDKLLEANSSEFYSLDTGLVLDKIKNTINYIV
jgi:hypothetical protein